MAGLISAFLCKFRSKKVFMALVIASFDDGCEILPAGVSLAATLATVGKSDG